MHEMEMKTQATFLEKTLDRRVVANPTYDEQGKNPCDEGTRIVELAEIKKWLTSISSGSQNFLWLTGDPGCGKSAITASIARDCKDNGTLWAQFFINRNNRETTDPNSYFPTIARQLADHSPDVQRVIYDRLREKRSLMDCISSQQAAKLFVDALEVASRLNPTQPVLVIIDGLDETNRNHLNDTAIIFSCLFTELTRYPNVKVFISSRTEDDIRNPFARNLKVKYVKHVHLDTATSLGDVSSFLRKKVGHIVERNGLNWEIWPGEERMSMLAARASGLFIWAVTVARFLQEQIDEYGTQCLEEILDALTGEALHDINTLYGLILCVTHPKNATDWDFETFRRIMGAIVVSREPLCLDDLANLLDLRQTPSRPRVDIVNFVRRLRTVLVAGADAVDDKTIPRLHKSFFEFITSPGAFTGTGGHFRIDPRFCIDVHVAEAELVLRCMRQFQLFYGKITDDWETVIPGQLRYACRFWSSHLRHMEGPAIGLVLGEGTTRSIPNLRNHLRLSPAGYLYKPLTISLSSDRSELSSTFCGQNYRWDMKTGDQNPSVLTGHCGAWVCCVAFSPDGTLLVSGSDDCSVVLWDMQNHSLVRSFKGHTDSVWTVAFSPHGNVIASGSNDSTIRLWDPMVPESIAVLRGDMGRLSSVAFSPDGTTIASASSDGTVRIWNVRSRQPVGLPLYDHAGPVLSLVYTPDGQQILSGADDGTIHIWDGFTGELLSRTRSKSGGIRTLSISSDGNRVLAGSRDGILAWTRNGQNLLPMETSFHLNTTVYSLAFSPDGMSFAFDASDGPHVNFWDMRTGHSTQYSGNLANHIHQVAFSPDGSKIAFGDAKAVCIWDTPQPVATFSALSPDGTLILSHSIDGHVRLRDSRTGFSVGYPLQPDVGKFQDFVFSSDSSRIGGATERGIYVWDALMGRLLAEGTRGALPPIVSLSFLLDRRTLFSTHDDDSMYTWEEKDGNLTPYRQSFDADDDLDQPSFFAVDEEHPQEVGGARWFPAKEGHCGFWASLDGCLIRGNEDGSIVVLSETRPVLSKTGV